MTDSSVVLSYGMGVESTAILMRWILEPETRPCDLRDLIVITAQVGDEYRDTGRDVETHILPLMRRHGIRFVQVARHGHREADGITILDDSREPERVYLDGDYKLSTELRTTATVPTFAGVHKCALKFKAFVIERWLSDHLGRDICHAIGYNAEETGRIAKSEYSFEQRAARVAFGFNADETGRMERAGEYDGLRGAAQPAPHEIPFGYNAEETGRITKNSEYNTFTRTAFYPLVEWNWTRQDCLDYLRRVLGVTWKKSACVFCPFAHNRQNLPDLLARHREHPEQVADAMLIEHTSLSMNPRGSLYRDTSLIQITKAAGNGPAVAAYNRKLSTQAWALYRVRRIYNADKKNPAKKGQADRAVEKLAVFPAATATLLLNRVADRFGVPVHEQHGIGYVYEERTGDGYPAREAFYVTAPAVVDTKARYGIPWFDGKWNQHSLFA